MAGPARFDGTAAVGAEPCAGAVPVGNAVAERRAASHDVLTAVNTRALACRRPCRWTGHVSGRPLRRRHPRLQSLPAQGYGGFVARTRANPVVATEAIVWCVVVSGETDEDKALTS